jgi:hypothetical protein
MFRFTIRDVLWLTVLAAVLILSWMNYRARRIVEAENRELQKQNAELAERNERQRQILNAPVTGSDTQFGTIVP